MIENETYCRIEDGQIVEYPVYALHIRNRAHPFSMYTKVSFAQKPEVPDFCYLTSKIELISNIPLVTWQIVEKPLQVVLNELHNVNGSPALPGEEPTRVEIEDVPLPTMQRVVKLAKDMVQARLDTWASTKEYDGIVSACTYVSSTNPTRAAEGLKACVNRDLSWDAMYAYMEKVQTKAKPVPLKVEEIVAELPELTW